MFQFIKRPLFSCFFYSQPKNKAKMVFKMRCFLTEKKNKNEFDYKKNLLFNPEPDKVEKISLKIEQNNENNNQDHNTNLKILKRELKNDSVQLPLKFFAFYTAAPNLYINIVFLMR